MSNVRFTDGKKVDVIDADCEFRPCFRWGEDKGPFTPGVGYTSYYPVARPVCLTRHLNGCPHVGVHLKCGNCHKTLGLVMGDLPRGEKPAACSECGSEDLYWLADVLPEPEPCCDNPVVSKRREGSGYRAKAKCKSCGTWLRGKRLRDVEDRAAVLTPSGFGRSGQ